MCLMLWRKSRFPVSKHSGSYASDWGFHFLHKLDHFSCSLLFWRESDRLATEHHSLISLVKFLLHGCWKMLCHHPSRTVSTLGALDLNQPNTAAGARGWWRPGAMGWYQGMVLSARWGGNRWLKPSWTIQSVVVAFSESVAIPCFL